MKPDKKELRFPNLGVTGSSPVGRAKIQKVHTGYMVYSSTLL